jgi:hypothetical protein
MVLRFLDYLPPGINWTVALLGIFIQLGVAMGGSIFLEDFDSEPYTEVAFWKLFRMLLTMLLGPYSLPYDLYTVYKIWKRSNQKKIENK